MFVVPAGRVIPADRTTIVVRAGGATIILPAIVPGCRATIVVLAGGVMFLVQAGCAMFVIPAGRVMFAVLAGGATIVVPAVEGLIGGRPAALAAVNPTPYRAPFTQKSRWAIVDPANQATDISTPADAFYVFFVFRRHHCLEEMILI
jgi:hypothetical protein